jgi:hypothetical protein
MIRDDRASSSCPRDRYAYGASKYDIVIKTAKGVRHRTSYFACAERLDPERYATGRPTGAAGHENRDGH